MRPLGVLLCLLVGLSCDRTSHGSDGGRHPDYKEPMINGFLYRVEYYDNSVEYSRDFEVFDDDGLRMVPVVTVNGAQMPAYYYGWTAYRYGDDREFRVDTAYRLQVEHYWGQAEAEIPMPGNFRLVYPPDDYILEQDSVLLINWRSSSRAEWYWVDIYLEYEFYDQNGLWDDLSFELDTIIGDTFLLLPQERLFPGQVAEVLEGDGAALVWAGGGPSVEPGDTGNVTGAGFGFFSSANEPKEKYFYVQAPPVERRCPGVRHSLRKMLALARERAEVAAD